jgi:ubiquinone/menaquinone biosynthesis C-methylase UbiE
VIGLTFQSGEHRRFSETLAFTLNNPIRRFLDRPEQLISKLNVGSADTAVDFGCGTGFFTIPLASVAGRTIAIDVSSKMLCSIASYAKRHGLAIELLKSDGTEIGLQGESVDLILLVHVLHEVENGPRVLDGFLRIMKPAGRLVIVEKTRGSRILSGRLGPPIVNELEIIREIEKVGFSFSQTLPFGKDSILVCQKTGAKP